MNTDVHVVFVCGLVLIAVFAVRAVEAFAPCFFRWYRRTAHAGVKAFLGLFVLAYCASFAVIKDTPQGGAAKCAAGLA